MNNKNLYFILILLFVFNLNGSSQIKKAGKLFKLYNYAEAIPLYEKSAANDNADIKLEATQRLADCYRLTNNAAEARFWYEKALKLNDADPINYFYLGQALRNLEHYDKAAEAFKAFNTIYPDSLDAGKYYQYCIDIKPWLDLPPAAEIKNVETLNSKYSDFGPARFKKQIVFASDRVLDVLDKNVYGWTSFNYLDLYTSTPENFSSYWSAMSEPKVMKRHFNQSYHDGPAAFSSDFKQIFITKTENKDARKDGKGLKTYLLKIFYADIVGDKKVNYRPFFLNSKEYSVAHPTLSDDNSIIIFSSDMPGGYGGSDLYSCTMVNGTWGEPVNLGPEINTGGDEVFPYLANDSVLFFSSDGLMGFGGLDIFKSLKGKKEWGSPENLKKPLNSSYDDFGVLFSDDLSEGLFSSNRVGGKGSDDIYAFRGLKGAQASTKSANLVASGFVKEMADNQPVNDATVFLFNPTTDEVLILKSDEKGHFESEVLFDQPYVVKAMKNGYIYDCNSFRTPADESLKTYNLPRDLLLAKLEVNQGFTVQNIYYDLDKWFIRKDAEEPLNNLVQIMKEYPIKAELSSHTDSRASNEYNMELSQKRAEAAVRYIVMQGINPSRLTAKGYGETRLVNKCADGVDCTEAEHQANRRTEFKITAIDNSLTTQNPFNPDIFRVGDLISAKLLDPGFFSNCLIQKVNLRDYLVPVENHKP